MPPGKRVTPVVHMMSGPQTGDVVYETSDGQLWEKADPWELRDPPTGFRCAVLINGHIFED